MAQFLSKDLDEDHVIVDASMLVHGAAFLGARSGWSRDEEAPAEVEAVYNLGRPGLYLHGERVVFSRDGTLSLSAFASNADVAFVQVIELAADGSVLHNGVSVLPP